MGAILVLFNNYKLRARNFGVVCMRHSSKYFSVYKSCALGYGKYIQYQSTINNEGRLSQEKTPKQVQTNLYAMAI